MQRGVESETSDEEEIGMEHIGIDNVFGGGVFDAFADDGEEVVTGITDDFGSHVAEVAPVFDASVSNAEPVLERDFDDL